MISPALDYCVLLNELGFECDEPNDNRVYRPSEKWLFKFGGYLFRNRSFYRVELFDCDNFAAWACVLATQSLLTAGIRDCDHSVIRCTLRIAGEPVNKIPGPCKHACNLVWLSEGPIVLFEPQNGEFVDAKEAVASGAVEPRLARW